MKPQDITEYSDDELSLLVFNDEALYLSMHKPWFLQDIRELFKFTPAQFEVLKNDLDEDNSSSK